MFYTLSIQIELCVVSHGVVMTGAIKVLSGGLYTYFVMRVLSGRTSKFIMWWVSIWIDNGQNITQNNCLQGKKKSVLLMNSLKILVKYKCAEQRKWEPPFSSKEAEK